MRKVDILKMNFSACADLCTHHHTQDTEPQNLLMLPLRSSTLPLPISWPPSIHFPSLESPSCCDCHTSGIICHRSCLSEIVVWMASYSHELWSLASLTPSDSWRFIQIQLFCVSKVCSLLYLFVFIFCSEPQKNIWVVFQSLAIVNRVARNMSCPGLCVDIRFHLSRVNTQEWDGWVTR